jgi:acyl-CoA reductase-like NAD-dependent aldehyde dehydrogenase
MSTSEYITLLTFLKVFSGNLNHAMAVANRIEAGATHVNTMSIHDEATLPHGGVKVRCIPSFCQ